MSLDAKKASEISECEECPLFGSDCIGGWTSDGAGRPIEPPCTSWNDDDEIYEGMYDYEPTSFELEMWRDISAQKEAERKEHKHRVEIQRLRDLVWSLTKSEYRHIEFRENSSIVHDWLCPYCNTWRRPTSESGYSGVLEAWCSKCCRKMVFCAELEREDFE